MNANGSHNGTNTTNFATPKAIQSSPPPLESNDNTQVPSPQHTLTHHTHHHLTQHLSQISISHSLSNSLSIKSNNSNSNRSNAGGTTSFRRTTSNHRLRSSNNHIHNTHTSDSNLRTYPSIDNQISIESKSNTNSGRGGGTENHQQPLGALFLYLQQLGDVQREALERVYQLCQSNILLEREDAANVEGIPMGDKHLKYFNCSFPFLYEPNTQSSFDNRPNNTTVTDRYDPFNPSFVGRRQCSYCGSPSTMDCNNNNNGGAGTTCDRPILFFKREPPVFSNPGVGLRKGDGVGAGGGNGVWRTSLVDEVERKKKKKYRKRGLGMDGNGAITGRIAKEEEEEDQVEGRRKGVRGGGRREGEGNEGRGNKFSPVAAIYKIMLDR